MDGVTVRLAGTFAVTCGGLPDHVAVGSRKARLLLGWRPEYDLPRMVESAWTYQRAADDPRIIWYPG